MALDTASLLEDAAALRDHDELPVRTLALGANEAAYEVNELEHQLAALTARLADANRQIARRDAVLSAATNEIRLLKSRLESALTELHGQLARARRVSAEVHEDVDDAVYFAGFVGCGAW